MRRRTVAENKSTKAIKSKQANDDRNQAPYVCEGFIKTVEDKGGDVSFTLDPVAPYFFEKKEEGGRTKKLLLFVDNQMNPCEARVLDGDEEPKFVAPSKCDLSALLIARANRLKIRVISNLALVPILVEELTVL